MVGPYEMYLKGVSPCVRVCAIPSGILSGTLGLGLRMNRLDRHFVRIYRSHAAADDGGYMAGTPEERLSQVWELTRESWFFLRGNDAEQRLQRDVAVLIRPSG